MFGYQKNDYIGELGCVSHTNMALYAHDSMNDSSHYKTDEVWS